MFGPLFERGVGMLERLLFVWDLDGVARGGAHGFPLCLRKPGFSLLEVVRLGSAGGHQDGSGKVGRKIWNGAMAL